MATSNQVLVLGLAAGGLALYSRGVPQKVWAAVWSDRAPQFGSAIPTFKEPAQNLGAATYPGSATPDEWQQSGCNVGNYSCLNAWKAANPGAGIGGVISGGGNPTGALVDPAKLRLAETAVSATRPASDWVNWCLQWVDDVRSRLGMGTWYGKPNAYAACTSSQLRQGAAPLGAAVCFSQAYGTDGHIGISNGDCTYTSAGFAGGGIQTRRFCGDGAYMGWLA